MENNKYTQEINGLGFKILCTVPAVAPLDGRLERPGRVRYEGHFILTQSLEDLIMRHEPPRRTQDGRWILTTVGDLMNQALQGVPIGTWVMMSEEVWMIPKSWKLKALASERHLRGLLHYANTALKRSPACQRKAIMLMQHTTRLINGKEPNGTDHLADPEDLQDVLHSYCRVISDLRERANNVDPQETSQVLRTLYFK